MKLLKSLTIPTLIAICICGNVYSDWEFSPDDFSYDKDPKAKDFNKSFEGGGRGKDIEFFIKIPVKEIIQEIKNKTQKDVTLGQLLQELAFYRKIYYLTGSLRDLVDDISYNLKSEDITKYGISAEELKPFGYTEHNAVEAKDLLTDLQKLTSEWLEIAQKSPETFKEHFKYLPDTQEVVKKLMELDAMATKALGVLKRDFPQLF